MTHLSCIIALLLWKPHPHQLAVFFVFSGLWGVADAVWQTQNNGESPLGGPYLGQRGGHMAGKGPADPGPPGEVMRLAASLEQDTNRDQACSRCLLGLEHLFKPRLQKKEVSHGHNLFP